MKLISTLIQKIQTWNVKTEIKVALLSLTGIVIAALIGGAFMLVTAFVPIIFGPKLESDQVKVKGQEVQLTELNAENNGQMFNVNKTSGDVTVVNNNYGQDPQLKEKVEEIEKQLGDTKNRLNSVEKFENLNALVKIIYEREKVEKFKHDDKKRMYIIPREQGFAFVLFRLEHVPIPQTVQLKYYIYAQPEGSYSAYKNLIIFNWSDSVEKLREKDFSLRYVADYSRDKEQIDWIEEEGFLVAESIAFRLSDGQPFNVKKK